MLSLYSRARSFIPDSRHFIPFRLHFMPFYPRHIEVLFIVVLSEFPQFILQDNCHEHINL